MRIPIEHFSTTPVFALSPIGPIESQSKRIELDQSLNNPQGSQAYSVPSRKVSLPSGYHHHSTSGVGSAPNSPKSSPKSSQETLNDSVPCHQDQPLSLLPTISGMMVGASQPPASLPPFMLNKNNNSKYATLPTK